LLINWQFWRKNANHHEKSIFSTGIVAGTHSLSFATVCKDSF